MQMSNTLLRRLYFGYNPAELCLRLEANADLGRYSIAVYLSGEESGRVNAHVRFGGTSAVVENHGMSLGWEAALNAGGATATLSRAAGNDFWETVNPIRSVAFSQRVVEWRLPLADVGLRLGDNVSLVVALALDGVLTEILPTGEAVIVTLAPLG